MARWLTVVALVGLAAVPQDKLYSNSYKGKAPPELASEKAQWFNADKGLQLGKLKGKVVWLEFGYLN